MSLSKVIAVATEQLGVTEYPPGSNLVKYNTEYYGMVVSGSSFPWCVTFLWWCFKEAGESAAFFGGARTASCTTLANWYKAQGQSVSIHEAQAGDIAYFNFHGTQAKEHCGLVVGTTWDIHDPEKLAGITTIEGNTSPAEGSQDNGGCVALKARPIKYVVEVVRPVYKPEEQPKDYEGHWAEEAIRWCIKQGLMKGYEDGNFQPDKPVTRAELATILERLGAKK